MKEIELISKRKQNEKHFLNKDGTITAKIYNQNIHYKKNGKYEEIDNTLTKKDGYYSNKQNDYKVYFKNQSTDDFFKIEKDNYYLNIKLKNEKETKIRKKKRKSKFIEDISYTNILDGINIEYKTLPTKVKETIVLKNKNSVNNSLIFFVDTNLELELEKNEILFKDKEEVIFTIEKPYMIDKNEVVSHNVRYFVERTKDGYEIELDLDMEWLMDKNTKYPVRIDPTITNNIQGGGVQDTYIFPGDNGVDRNNQDILKAGVERINGSYRTNRSLIKFDLPKIGTGSEVISAGLNLVAYPEVTAPNNEKIVGVYRVTEDWNEGNATWDRMNNKYAERVESIVPTSRSFIYAGSIIPTPSLYNDITDLVKKWYRDTPNYGILLKSTEEKYIDDNYPAFFSKNNSVQGDDPRPFLTITYRNQSGLENYLNYQSHSFTDASVHINTYNGNMVGIFTGGSTIGGPLPASIDYIYNTNDAIINNGNGYMFSLAQLIKTSTIENYLEYYDEDRTIHYFYKNNTTGIYHDEDGLELTIEMTDANCYLKDKQENKKTFIKRPDNLYHLIKIEDVKGNTIDLELNSSNSIKRIVDASNSEILIDRTVEGKITIINPDFINKTEFRNGKLYSLETNHGKTEITYDEKGLITSITDVTGMKVEYEYYSEIPYKVKKVTQYGIDGTVGNSFTLNYGFNETTITDNKGRVNTLIFNSLGNLLSSNNMSSEEDISNAYSTTQEYGKEQGEETYFKNKLLSSTIPVKYIKNYLKNTSFENDEQYFTATNGIQKTFSTECSVTGNRSLKIVSNQQNQSIISGISNLEKGKYYTFSGYFKNDKPIKLIMGTQINNEFITYNTEKIKASPNEFLRHDISFLYEGESQNNQLYIKILFEELGTTYIDNIQLEEGDIANNYNIISNSDFSDGLNDWTFEATKYDYSNATNENPTITSIPTNQVFSVVKFNNNKNTALKIKMNPTISTNFKKVYPIKGKKDDIYNISFWIKNRGILGNDYYVSNSVMIYFKPVGKDADYCILRSPEFQPNEKWQYVSFRYKAEEDYESVSVMFIQEKQVNEMYITNLSFYKDLDTDDYEYDENGNIISIKNSSKNVSDTFGYDKNNQLISATSPKGKNFKYEYDNTKTDQVLSAMSSMGISNKVEYDNFGNPIKTKISKKINEELNNGLYLIRNKGTNQYINAEEKNIIVDNDQCSNTIWKIEKEEENVKILHSIMDEYSLSSLGNIAILTNSNPAQFTLVEKKNGSYLIKKDSKYLKVNQSNLELATLIENDPSFEFYFEIPEEKFIETTATYSDDGRFVTSVTDSNFNTTTYDIDQVTGLTKSMTNAKNQTTNYTYNEKQQITSVTQKDKTVSYTYNNQNKLEKIIQGNKEYKFVYDNFLNPKEVHIGNNITLVNNEYEPNNGNLLKTTYGNNQVVTFEYDEFDRAKIIHKVDKDYHYRYDSNGNIAKIIEYNKNNEEESTTKCTYDTAKRIEEYRKDGFRINYGYDKNDNVTSKKYRLNETIHEMNNTYDKDDQLTSTTIDNETVDYHYDSLERLSNKTINNSYNTVYEYVSKGRRTSELIKSIQNGNNKYSYKYDKLNNLTHIYYNNNLKNQYYYDEYNELIKEEDYLKNEKTEYIYDNSGNLLTKITKNLETDDIISTDTYEYQNDDWEDQLTKFNNQEIIYDEIGNPLSIGNNITLNWINGRSLNSYIDTSKNLNINYKYNKDGIRIEKEVNGVVTKYYLENSNIIYEQRGDSTIYYLYDLTGLVGLKYNNNTYYYIKNIQGDIIGILDQDYNEIVTYEYDSWGKLLSIKDSQGNEITDETNIGIINPFGYREYYYDSETNLYYLNSRYYNPEWGRFLSQDITVGEIGGNFLGHNIYQYAFNNPINLDDSGGAWPKWAKNILKATAVVAVVAVVSIVTVATSGVGTVAATIALGALKGAVIGTIIGATIGAVGGAVKQRITTGSWNGTQEQMLNGMGNGALSGAINGAASGTLSTTNRVINTAKNWNKGTFRNRTASLDYHYKKHVIREGGPAANIFEYTNDALDFANQNQNLLRFKNDPKHGNQIWEFKYKGRGGKYEGSGNIITFWYRNK